MKREKESRICTFAVRALTREELRARSQVRDSFRHCARAVRERFAVGLTRNEYNHWNWLIRGRRLPQVKALEDRTICYSTRHRGCEVWLLWSIPKSRVITVLTPGMELDPTWRATRTNRR